MELVRCSSKKLCRSSSLLFNQVLGVTTFRNYSSQVSASVPLRCKKKKADFNSNKHFVDYRQVHLIGGRGGNGGLSFMQLFCNPLAGPDGGNGGNGGHIILVADTSVKSLEKLQSEYRAEDGEKGMSKHCHGKSAPHTVIEVPLGTIVKEDGGPVIADLDFHGASFIAARGGAGGHGNHHFMSNDNKAPHISEFGAKGEDRRCILEMRIMAHAGLIGFPNAGKSTLLRAISRARPKVAQYPFTTLNPHVGMVLYDDYEQIAVADIPGLIPGAHKNYGLGISFLRHVERCLCLLYVIDLSYPEPWEQLDALKYELEQYSPGLSTRPHAILGNKIDLPEAQVNFEALQERTGNLPVIPISAKKGANVSALLRHLRELYDAQIK